MTDPLHTEPVEVTQADRDWAEEIEIQFWSGTDDLPPIVARIRTAAEAASRAREDALVSLLTKAVGDIAAALEAAGSAGLIRKWTADYVAAINAHDARAALNPAAKGGE